MSRVTVREAMRRPLSDDLVEVLPHRGVRVRRQALAGAVDGRTAARTR